MSVRLYLQIGWRVSISFADFFTPCGVPLAEALWSNMHRHDAATHMQIRQPTGNKRQLFF